MTDVPFGVLLSGGLDSSLVAAVASRHMTQSETARQWGSQLHTFCIGLKVVLVTFIWIAIFFSIEDFITLIRTSENKLKRYSPSHVPL